MKKMFISALAITMFLNITNIAFAKTAKPEKEYIREIGYLMKNGKLDQAIELNNKMLTDYPNSLKAYASMTFLYSKINDFEDAIFIGKKGISIAPESPTQEEKDSLFQIHNVFANIYKRQGKNIQAIQELKTCIELKPNSDGSYYIMGILYAQIGEYNNAREAFNACIQIGPNGESKGALTSYATQALEKIKDR